jgi:hypothetical protein
MAGEKNRLAVSCMCAKHLSATGLVKYVKCAQIVGGTERTGSVASKSSKSRRPCSSSDTEAAKAGERYAERTSR